MIPLSLVRSPTLADFGHAARLRRISKDFDIMHLHSSKAGAIGRIALAGKASSKLPKVVFSPHAWSWLAQSRLSVAYKQFERFAARYADVIVAVSQDEAAEGRRVLGRNAGRIDVIENGVDEAKFSPDGPTGDQSGSFVIACVGQLDPRKGQDILIEALGMLRHSDVTVLFIGEGPHLAAYQSRASTLGVENRVRWIGNVADTSPYLRSADLVVVPSRYDGLSLALLEAMSCAKCIVATDVVGASALKGCGVMVPPQDPRAMAAAIDQLVANESERKRLGGLARQRILDRYRLSESLGKTIKLWESLTP